MKIAIIDHHNSFTHNIDMWLRSVAPQVQTEIIAYDDGRAMAALQHALVHWYCRRGHIRRRKHNQPLTC